MDIKWFLPKGAASSDEYISISSQGFGFSYKFIKNYNLQKKEFVKFGPDPDDEYKFHVGFPEIKEQHCWELQGHKKGTSRTVKAYEFINDTQILKKIKDDKELHPYQRRFPII